MKKIVFFLIIIFLSLFFLIFHDKGNEILKPYVSSYLEHTLKQDISVEVQQLKIDLHYVEFSALLNKVIKLNAEGNLSLFTQKGNLNYTLKSDNFKNKIDIKGTLIGTFNDMEIQGEGKILKSHINYDLNLKDDIFQKVKLTINQADIASLLQVLSKPPYAKGKVDINIESKEKVKILLHSSILDEKIFKKEFNIDLPKATVITANLTSQLTTTSLQLEGEIKSDFATVALSNASYDIKANEFLSNYLLIIPRLSKLLFLSKKKLNGKFKINGEIKLRNKNINITGSSSSLGGKTNFSYNGKSLNTFMDNVEITKVLYLLNKKPYAVGEMDAHVKLSDLAQLRGSFELKTKNAKTINHIFKKELNLNFGRPIAFSLESTGNIAENMLTIQSKIKSNILTCQSNDLQYNLNNSTLNSNYQLEIPKLSKLNTLVGKSLNGKLSIEGKMDYNNNLIITGSTRSLDGNIDFRLADKKLNTNIKNISVEKLMYLFSYPQVLKANLLGNLNYNLATKKGRFTSTLNNARLLSSELTLSIKQLRGVDLTKEHYNKSYFNANFNKNLIDIKFEAKNKKVLLAIPSGRINKNNNSINATFNIKVNNREIEGRIQGSTSDPRIVINSSKFIKDEIFNELGFSEKEKGMMKSMMDSFF